MSDWRSKSFHGQFRDTKGAITDIGKDAEISACVGNHVRDLVEVEPVLQFQDDTAVVVRPEGAPTPIGGGGVQKETRKKPGASCFFSAS